MDNITNILSPAPFPNIGWWQQLLAHENVIDIHAHYQKMTYRNRYEIGGANGKIRLSIPLENGRNQRIPIKDVTISYQTDWQRNHWKSIESAYKRTPYFEYYADRIEPLYKTKINLLLDWNIHSIELIQGILKIANRFTLSNSYIQLDKSNERYNDWREYNGKSNIAQRLTPYMQPFDIKNGFCPNLSILDLVFCEGPRATSYLK